MLPHFGADFGSVLAFVPLIIGLVFTKWSYRAIRLRRIAIAIPTGLVATAVVARLVIAISPDTHVGSIGSSGGVFALIRAKLATSQRVLLISPVGVAVVLVALGILAIIMLRPSWFGRFDTWRAGVWWMCIATLIGGAVNDSGVVIVGIGVAFCHVMVGLLGPGQSLIEKREAP